jgi:CHAT domain-containing protein
VPPLLRTGGGAPSYLALIRGAERADPVLVPLGEAGRIDTLVAAWREQFSPERLERSKDRLRSEEPDYREMAARLRRAAWDPIEPHLRGVARAFIVPDGALGLVGFAALPTGETRYVLDSGPPLHYLSAERDLITFADSSAAGDGLLALGDIRFDCDPGSPAGGAGTAPDDSLAGLRGGLRIGCDEFRSLQFPRLGDTAIEIRSVTELWKRQSAADAQRVTLLTGSQATEDAFKRHAPGRRVLHLATHGFFLQGACVGVTPGMRGIGAIGAAGSYRQDRARGGNPLLLSGLVLACANQRASVALDAEDGVLTADEIAALDLRGLEWAVLSACDTGVGEVTSGEGVLGLRRAFRMAGARTIIMSLWSVPDEEAGSWMSEMYESRLEDGLDTAGAVQRASERALRRRRNTGRSTHPLFWASFVAAGDWR